LVIGRFFEFFDGKHDLKTAIELIKQHTRNYAKRQITWTKRYADAHYLDYSSIEEMTDNILKTRPFCASDPTMKGIGMILENQPTEQSKKQHENPI
jgi:hypothetical protein